MHTASGLPNYFYTVRSTQLHQGRNNWSMTSEPDYYEILQVSPRAEPDVIEAAYRRLARKYHPDLNPGVDALQQMSELNRAFDVLNDPRKRAEYDRRRLRALAQKALEDGVAAGRVSFRLAAHRRRRDGSTRGARTDFLSQG